jgi:putative transposase
VKFHPFVEAEKVAGHGVKRCCELLEVSRAAFYQRLDETPSEKEIADAELTE